MIILVMMIPAAQGSLWHLGKYSLNVNCSVSWEQCKVL